MASSSTHHQQQQIWNHDVFLSFRGEDIRMSFVDHLYAALKQKGIDVFKDDKGLERGEPISPELLKAIEESRFSIIIFSENYAFSKWCLDELLKIMDCTKQKHTGHKALPIFYNVDPSDVRNQTGTYGEAFVQHERYIDSIEKIHRWRRALTEASNISGWDSRNRHESELIQEIVEKIFSKLKHGNLLCKDNLVGMDFHLREMNTLLSKDPNDVKFIGIYGLGGIGKTTIAKAIYTKISCQFEACSFLANVREKSKQNGLVNLQRQLLRDILNVHSSELEDDKISGMIENRLCNKRVLVILDDVDHIDQLEGLVGSRHWFGFGSRIIITTRDEHLLDVHGVVERYKVKALDYEKSVELFSWKAFKQNHPAEDFIKLSDEVVNYTKGLPLALKVLGSFLCDRNETAWTSALDKLKKVPHKDIVQVLKITYDGLEEMEKKIFLDIACFFNGKNKEYVTNFLDRCGFFPGIGMEVLKDMSLITVSDNNKVLMHDLVQDMGRGIVRQECPGNPGGRSRLWLDEDIHLVLKNNVGTEAVEAIVMEKKQLYKYEPSLPSLRLSSKSFKKMCKLRWLEIRNVQIEIPKGLTNLSDELRILHWEYCPLKYLPSTFRPDKLIELKICSSRIEHLWHGMKFLENLKSVDLRWCERLTEIPDLTAAPNLEVLILEEATELSKIHSSVGLLKRLKYLSLSGCWKLSSFPSRIDMESLETLDLCGCSSLKELPSSINNIPKLKVLDLSDCVNLECLPNSTCGLKYLEELLLDGCSKLTKLPEKLGDLESLVKLDASRTAIKEVPRSIVLLKKLQRLFFVSHERRISSSLQLHSFSGLWSLTDLDLGDCNLSDGMIPDDIGSLSSLKSLNLGENMFVELPSSICQLTRLTGLSVEGCKRILELPELPPSIEIINANDCESLERLPNPSTEFKSTKNVRFSFVNCFGICKTQPSLTDVVQLFQHQALFGNSKTFSLTLPGNHIPEWFSHQNKKEPSSILWRLPSNWYNSKLRGLAFCVVAGPPQIGITASFKVNPFESIGGGGLRISNNDSPIEIPYIGYETLTNDHLVMSYVPRDWLWGKEKETGMMETKFYFNSRKARVIKCGIRLVYSEDDVVDEKKKAKFFKGSPKLRRSLKRKRSMSRNLWHRYSKRVLLRFTSTRKKRKNNLE